MDISSTSPNLGMYKTQVPQDNSASTVNQAFQERVQKMPETKPIILDKEVVLSKEGNIGRNINIYA